jgi:hypothetical protein
MKLMKPVIFEEIKKVRKNVEKIIPVTVAVKKKVEKKVIPQKTKPVSRSKKK